MNNQVLFKMLEGQNIDNKYYLKKLLGAGGFGGVYLADEVVKDRLIRELAVKLIISEDSEKQLDELIFSTTLNHPNLINCYTCGEYELNNVKFLYLLMEVADSSLEKELIENKLDREKKEKLITDITEAISFLHSQSPPIIHRDLKPANILKVGNKWKLADFGLVRILEQNLTIQNTINITGTIGYSSPESYEGRISRATDIWSLGILIIEISTGKLPFDNENLEQTRNLIINGKILIPQLDYPFNQIARQCLIKDYQNRISAEEILEILKKTKNQPPIYTINQANSNIWLIKINVIISILSFLILIVLSIYTFSFNKSKKKINNLIKNGSFEEGITIDPETKFIGLDTKSQGINDWEIIKDNIDYKENYWQNTDDNRSLDLNGGQAGAISQSFPTKIGERYLVQFDMAGNPDHKQEQIPIRKIIVSTGEQQGHFVFDMRGGKTRENMQWQTFKWKFIAENSMTTLTFSGSLGNTSAYGPTLDNIIVTEISEND
ncbi:choice-of-anchor C family protein [Cyanobacterium aponinum]|uniref:Choice-of-anchor C family protein n=1 Tax=Cyanobacterium aponinum 0216 TaxID=2676140 RepID=A0A844GV30_9CHRO|nr:choice-of-anchor C family protein [Cyanobacterium aponinum]MTF40324.1 choice-of-anchor C family protein [Cyanobacterium aponinum 0216]